MTFGSADKIVAEPGSDIWRKPPSTDVFNAPYISNEPSPGIKSRPLTTFESAQASFSADWTQQYDQAGLLLIFHSSSGSPKKWIKTGVEFYLNASQLSTVACDRWADWSVTPLPAALASKPVTLVAESEKSDSGKSIWIFYLGEGGEKVPLREVCWPYAENGGEGYELEVAIYAARPESEATKESLTVNFQDMKVTYKE